MLLRVLRQHPGARGLGVDLDKDAIAGARQRATTLPAHGGFPKALPALGQLGNVALYGEGFWERPPTPEFLAALGGATMDELSDLNGLRAAVTQAGFEIEAEWLAGQDDWTRYEETLATNAERHRAPETLAYADRIRRRRALPGGTDTLGFALLVLRTR
jgi:hypothetical protein